jgi:hypothetical protein
MQKREDLERLTKPKAAGMLRKELTGMDRIDRIKRRIYSFID